MSTPPIPKLPQLDCSLLFPDLINFHMQNNPSLPMWVYLNDQGVTEITFLEFGRAAHRIAHALRPGRTGDDGQVVILIANTDTILHQVVIAGMSIAGLVPFPVSPRNSPAAVVHMMKKINCSRIVTLHHAHRSLIDRVREEGSCLVFTVEEMPTISYAFPKLGGEVQADAFVPYPQSASRPDPNVPSMYLHSSGSTGFPKPIPRSPKVQIHLMHRIRTAYLPKLSPGDRIGVMGLPPFHTFGVLMHLYLPLAHLGTAVVYPPQAITGQSAVPIMPTSDNILDGVRRTHCKAVVVVPAFLEQWVASTVAVEALTKLDQVIFGGGPLAEKVGNALWAAGVNICIVYGGTEFGTPVSSRGRGETADGEWMWMRFSEDVQVRWMPQGDGTYECQVLTTENNQMAVENLPDVKGYATSDLFIKHPTKNLWKIVGRADDVITLASGEKIVPMPMEGIIIASPLIQGVVVFGRGRSQVGILVEPSPEHVVDILDNNAVAAFKNEIWPVIDEANKIAPAFARIFKEMVLVADPKLPMARTSKGTVQRKATINAYEARINSLALYVGVTHGSIEPFAWTTEGVLACTINQGRSLDPNADLFAQGFDSLSATYLRNLIVNALRNATDAHARGSVSLVSPNSPRIASLVGEHGVSQSLDTKQQHVAAMNTMIEKHCARLSGSAGVTNGTVVLLTGSTGGLGSFLLSQLLKNRRVERVYALNRTASSTSIEERQSSAFLDKGLSVDLLNSGKLVYVKADASRDNCGLASELYEEIRDSVTIVIHSAWRLDFNLSLVSFEPNIKATRNLVDLALNAKHRSTLRFVFTSTIGTAQSWDRTKGAFPEEPQLDPSAAVGTGYGESKYSFGLRGTSLRIGQIAGGPNGSWAVTDWVPIIVKSSIALGSLPDSLGVVSWMRAEDVADVVLDIAFADSAPQSLNILNPKRARWSESKSPLHGDRLTIIPFVEWVTRLEEKAADATLEDLADIPALKLLEFFRSMARNEIELSQSQGSRSVIEVGGAADFSTDVAQRISNTVSRMQPVGELEARAWIQYWISKGLF
ncbi:acetyl-CoA synthetase-like protein [Boletus coccyginus]|nr:acetyl-CoA synthetase-like protein [Boletus coccyginus]